jgi:hypothetical protein
MASSEQCLCTTSFSRIMHEFSTAATMTRIHSSSRLDQRPSRPQQMLCYWWDRTLSTPVRKYGHVCAWGLPGEVAKRGGDDAVASSTTNDKEIAPNPHPPAGLGRDGPVSSLLLLDDDHASTRRRALTPTPSRSQQTSSYLWTGVLREPPPRAFSRPDSCVP